MEGFQSDLLSMKVNYIYIYIYIYIYNLLTICFIIILCLFQCIYFCFLYPKVTINDCSMENEKKRKRNSESPVPNLNVDLNPAKRQLQLQPPDDDITKNISLQVEQRSRTNSDIYFVQNLLSQKDLYYLQRENFLLHQQFQQKELQSYFSHTS